MKKILALLLILALLPVVPALADGSGYIRQLPVYKYIGTPLIDRGSYPEVRIAPGYVFEYFRSYDPAEPVFLCFPGPDGAQVDDFEVDSAHYLDETNLIQYSYRVKSSDSWEEFINEARSDAYILMDGSDGMAAYIDPERLRAYGMLAAREFGKSSKLVISITLDALSTKMPLDTIITALTEAILRETARVKAQMHYETYETYWNSGDDYAGVKFLEAYDYNFLFRLTFPRLPLIGDDGTSRYTGLIVTEMRYGKLEGVYNYGGGQYIQVTIALETYSFALTKIGENDADAREITLPNGDTWYIYMSGLTERGSSGYVHASFPLGRKDKYDNMYYLNILLDGEGIGWNGFDDLTEKASSLFYTDLGIMDPEDDPYEEPGPTPAPEAPAVFPGAWICTGCGAQNTGSFCTGCGKSRPWTCPKCGAVNNTNFCPDCGTARPEP